MRALFAILPASVVLSSASIGCNVARNSILPSSGLATTRDSSAPSGDTGELGRSCGGGELLLTEIFSYDGLVFVELWNHAPVDVDVSSYTLSNYNGGSTITLAEMVFAVVLSPNTGLVVTADRAQFDATYSTPADLEDTDINASGDDTFILSRGDDTADIYGEWGVDGVDRDWFFGDASAKRKPEVRCGRSRWDAAEWDIVAPSLATPGSR